MKTPLARVEAFRTANRECARIILSDPRYEGLMREWAELVLQYEPEQAQPEWELVP
jgi:hypothetical protein